MINQILKHKDFDLNDGNKPIIILTRNNLQYAFKGFVKGIPHFSLEFDMVLLYETLYDAEMAVERISEHEYGYPKECITIYKVSDLYYPYYKIEYIEPTPYNARTDYELKAYRIWLPHDHRSPYIYKDKKDAEAKFIEYRKIITNYHMDKFVTFSRLTLE